MSENHRKKRVSFVVPVYFEEQVLPEFYRRLAALMDRLAGTYDFEAVFVNDGSRDGTLGILTRLLRQDPRLRVVSFSRNFGHQIAVTAGLDHASGDALVIIDADLQDPPEVVEGMLRRWEEGYKVVYGQREKRAGETAFKRGTASLFYRLLGKLSDTPIPLDTGDFRLIDRAVADALRAMPERSRFLRGMVPWVGYPAFPLTYARDPRYAGETKYTLKKMLRFALDGITSFSEKPLRIAFQFSVLVNAAALLYILWLVGTKILSPHAMVPGWASVIVIVLFLGGMQLFSIGILGLYVGKIYTESKRRPLYVVEKAFGFPSPGVPEPGKGG